MTLSAVFSLFFVCVMNDAFNGYRRVCVHCILELPCDMAHPFVLMLIVFCCVMGLVEHCVCVDVDCGIEYCTSNVDCDVFRLSLGCPCILLALGGELVMIAARYVKMIVSVTCFLYG